jgi:mono/diheme cytochrome c family protein
MKIHHLCLLVLAIAQPVAQAGSERPRDAVALGRYLVQTAGCNDCHSPGYSQQAGKTPEATWLTGDALGWRGPWGTTYPTNLRLFMASMSESQWLAHARTMQPRPPMPWFNLRDMSDTDLRAIYRYVRAAGPAGKPAPAYLPPGQPVSAPVVQFP